MIEWTSQMFMCGRGGCSAVFEGICLGIRVRAEGGNSGIAYSIVGNPRIYTTETSLEAACRARQEGKHGENYLEIGRLRSMCLKHGINPDAGELDSEG